MEEQITCTNGLILPILVLENGYLIPFYNGDDGEHNDGGLVEISKTFVTQLEFFDVRAPFAGVYSKFSDILYLWVLGIV